MTLLHFMTRFLSQLVGFALILAGVYFLSQNVIFTTQTAGYWWKAIPATGSILTVLSGIFFLVSERSSNREIGWILVGLGIVLAFVSGGIIVKPTSLWTFLVSALAFVTGYKFVTTGRLRW